MMEQNGASGAEKGASSQSLVRTISFYKSLKLRSRTYIEPRAEIAFAGRSNAGKSSLINYLSGRRRLAYVGKQPGKTRLVNYFVVNDAFYLVDLPGYGYARVSKQELASWASMMETFFSESAQLLHGIVVCMDIRRDPSEQDVQMVNWARFYHVPCIVAATKADKIGKSRRPQAASRIAKALGDDGSGAVRVFAVSALGKFGAPALEAAIAQMLEEGREDAQGPPAEE